LALQTIVARSVDPRHSAVVSCTEFITDGIRNALPSEVVIKGDTRSDAPEVQALLEQRMRELCQGICQAHGAHGEVSYTHEFAPTVNWAQCVPVAVRAAQAVVGEQRVDADTPPMMISEDFGRFLQHIPGAFVFIGNGTGQGASADTTRNAPADSDAIGGIPLHNAAYDFNDAIVPIGARWFAELVRQRLPV
jgi:metal-dependent amidase/aminoacylase/carboxypeptidase family protein